MDNNKSETRYQRVAREQRERQAARATRMNNKTKKPKRKHVNPNAWHNDSGPAFPRDPDGMDRDNLGASQD